MEDKLRGGFSGIHGVWKELPHSRQKSVSLKILMKIYEKSFKIIKNKDIVSNSALSYDTYGVSKELLHIR